MQLANTARTTLVNSALATDTSILLSDASRFPTVTSTALTGTVTSDSNPYVLIGTGTLFTSQLTVGDSIVWTGLEHRRVLKIIDDTHLIIDRPASVAGMSLSKCDGYYVTLVVGGGLSREYVFVTGTSGATFTIVRAQDASTALACPAGTGVEYRVTVGVLQQVIEQAVLSAVSALMELKGGDLVGVTATNYVSATVRTALEEVMSALITHVGSLMAHAGTHITFNEAGWSSTSVEAAIVESVTKSLAALSGHESAVPAHAASAISFSPYAGISATDVQNAIQQAWDAFSVTTNSGAKVADVITSSGTAVNPLDAYQLSRAVSTYVAGSDYWQCAGSGSAFTLATPAQFPGIPGTPAFTGTGNGTMTGVAGTTQSVTETFTVTCVTPGTHAVFSVVGSVSGAQANATADTAYSVTAIGFTIHTGTTPFASGDKFVVSMAAAYGLRKPVAYFPGMRVRFVANAANGANATVDVGGLGARSVNVPPFADALPANAWIAGTIVELEFNGSTFTLVRGLHPTRKMYIYDTAGTATVTLPAGVTAFKATIVGGGGASNSGGAGSSQSSLTYNGVTYSAAGGAHASGGAGGGVTANGDIMIKGGTPATSVAVGTPVGFNPGGGTYVAPTGWPVRTGTKGMYGVGGSIDASAGSTSPGGCGGETCIVSITRVAGHNTFSYTVGAGGGVGGTGGGAEIGADGVIIIECDPVISA